MSKTSRRKFTSVFKSKVCLEAIKKQQAIEAVGKRFNQGVELSGGEWIQ